MSKLSGPLLDRIDLHVPIRAAAHSDAVQSTGNEESSKELLKKVLAARAVQHERGQHCLNGQLQGELVTRFCLLSPAASDLIAQHFDRLGLSMRGYHKVLKIARTIADLCGSALIEVGHIQEALSFRSLSR